MRKYLGNNDCFNLECLDTGKYKEGEIRIDPDDAKNYFDAWVIEDSEVNREKLRKIEEYNRLLENKERPNFAKPRITAYVPAESLSYKQIAEAVRKRLEGVITCEKYRRVIEGKRFGYTRYQFDRKKIEYHMELLKLRLDESDVLESCVK